MGVTFPYMAGSVGYPAAAPPASSGVLGMPDLRYSPAPDGRSPVPSAPVPLSSLAVNLSSPSQPPPYQPSALPPGTDSVSGIGGPPPPPPTGGFIPSHGIVSATPGKVSLLYFVTV